MRGFVSIASAFTLALLLGGQAIAQQPPANPPSGGTPDAMPFDIPYGMAITGEKAKRIPAAAEAEAKKRNWKMNIAVVHKNGDLVYFLRMDGAQIASVPISQGKARTAARYRRPTQIFYNASESGHPSFRRSTRRSSPLRAAFPWSRAGS